MFLERPQVDVDAVVEEFESTVLGRHEPRGASRSVGLDGIEQRRERDTQVRPGLLLGEIGPQSGGNGRAVRRPLDEQAGDQLLDPPAAYTIRHGPTIAAPNREFSERGDGQVVRWPLRNT